MEFPSAIFKAYDIRGIAGESVTVALAEHLGAIFANFLKSEVNTSRPLRLVVGRDMRLSSPALHEAVIKGMCGEGVTVIDVGLVSTPTFYFAVTHLGADGGIVVSASHNPQEWNGFKLVRANAAPVSGDTGIYRIRDLCQDVIATKQSNPVIPDAPGDPESSKSIEKIDDILNIETDWVLSQTDISQLPKLKIVADAANAMGAQYLEALFEKIPCELVRMNFELDGTFPAHEADPLKDENVRDVQARVVAEKADFGIATDGDGDRIFFFDETGARVEPAIVRALLAENILRLHPGAKICYDIRPGRITPERITAAGGVPIVTRVGHSLIKEHAIREGAKFAGESSGHMFFWYKEGLFEIPMLSVVKMLEEIGRFGGKVSEMATPYRTYAHSGEINFVVHDTKAVLDALADTYHDACLSWLDGLTIEYPDWWANVRASNTEPKVRLAVEGKNQELVTEKVADISTCINRFL
ncbi:MAG: phosphomannomutase/phosphoglucomutase [Patescibacteria group bacterium]